MMQRALWTLIIVLSMFLLAVCIVHPEDLEWFLRGLWPFR